MAVRKRMKLPLLLCVLLCVLLVCFSCQKQTGADGETASIQAAPEVASKSAEDVAQVLLDAIAARNMVQIDPRNTTNYYGVDMQYVSDSVIYVSAVSSYADEVAVFKLADGSDGRNVLTAVNERVASRERAFRELSPSEYDKLANAVSINNSGFVILAVSEKPEAVRAAVEILFYPELSTAQKSVK